MRWVQNGALRGRFLRAPRGSLLRHIGRYRSGGTGLVRSYGPVVTIGVALDPGAAAFILAGRRRRTGS
jgi:hypothetical protein